MRIGRAAAAALLGLGLSVPSHAQTVDEVVARHVAARGGEQKLQAIETMKITRTVGTPFTRVNVVIYRKRPGFSRTEQGPAGQPAVARGINPEAVWDPGPGGKVTIRPEPHAAVARDVDGDFDGDLLVGWKAKGHTVALAGKDTVGGVETWKLDVTTKAGARRTIYLDAATYLDRQHSGVNTLPNGRTQDFVMVFGNWKDVDGVKFPFDIDEERVDGQITQSFATYTHKIELNVPMEDAIFATPGK